MCISPSKVPLYIPFGAYWSVFPIRLLAAQGHGQCPINQPITKTWQNSKYLVSALPIWGRKKGTESVTVSPSYQWVLIFSSVAHPWSKLMQKRFRLVISLLVSFPVHLRARWLPGAMSPDDCLPRCLQDSGDAPQCPDLLTQLF